MGIFDKLKKAVTSDEVKELGKEIQDQTKQVADSVGAAASGAVATVKQTVQPSSDGKIDYDTFKQVEVRVGTILSVEPVPKSEKLLRLMVNVGEEAPRQIVSGIAKYFDDPQSLVDRQAMFVTNLEPRSIMGLESNGMIFAVSDSDNFSILEPDVRIAPGTQAS